MLMSSTYQQSTTVNAADLENGLYSRMNRLRLEGEIVRDSMLTISGRLNPKAGGPGVANDATRRSVYIFARRNLRNPFLEVFDAPDSNLSCAHRGQSTTARGGADTA